MLTVPFPFAKQRGLFCLFACLLWLFLPITVCVCSLSIPHGMHLVVPAHPYFFWVACYPCRTVIPTGHFPQNSLSKNKRIGFFFFFFLSLPIARPCLLTHDPPLSILAGYRLVVPGSCACFSFFTRRSCICHVLEIGSYVLQCTFGFLWHELFSDLPFFMTCFF